jgi:hypothetical protein
MAAPYDDEFAGIVREIRSRPKATGAVLNLIRATKMRVAAELTALSELVENGELQVDLGRLASEEARYGYALLERMRELRFTACRLPRELERVDELLAHCRVRALKDIYAIGGTVGDAEAMELLIATHVLKRHALVELRASHDALEHAPHVEFVVADMIRAEADHIDCLGDWIAWFERRFSTRAVQAARNRIERAFAQLNLTYLAALPDYFARVTSQRDRTIACGAYAVGQ